MSIVNDVRCGIAIPTDTRIHVVTWEDHPFFDVKLIEGKFFNITGGETRLSTHDVKLWYLPFAPKPAYNPNEWRPLDTMPRNGQKVIILEKLPFDDDFDTCVGFWHPTDGLKFMDPANHFEDYAMAWMPFPELPWMSHASPNLGESTAGKMLENILPEKWRFAKAIFDVVEHGLKNETSPKKTTERIIGMTEACIRRCISLEQLENRIMGSIPIPAFTGSLYHTPTGITIKHPEEDKFPIAAMFEFSKGTTDEKIGFGDSTEKAIYDLLIKTKIDEPWMLKYETDLRDVDASRSSNRIKNLLGDIWIEIYDLIKRSNPEGPK